MIKYFNKIRLKHKLNIINKKRKKSLIKNSLVREEDIKTLINVWTIFKKSNINNFNNYFNVCLYASLVNRDVFILWVKYTEETDPVTKGLFGRMLMMTIIEFLEDINGMLGKELSQELKRNSMSDLVGELNKINKKFSSIKKENNSTLRKIRNNASAHKTK